MAVLDLVLHPDPGLRVKCRDLPGVDDLLRVFLTNMAETMYANKGIGLAAPQVGQDIRAFVVDIKDGVDLHFFVNPKIVAIHGWAEWEEGCLSLPGRNIKTVRQQRVKIQAYGYDGQPFELEAHTLLAAAIQHEYDHLDGVLMLDRHEEWKGWHDEQTKKRKRKAKGRAKK